MRVPLQYDAEIIEPSNDPLQPNTIYRPCQDKRMARERGREYADGMMELSYRRHRFPPVVIQHAVWLYLRFTLSYRDVKDLLAERGLDISYETVRSWVLKFGPVIARRLQRRRPRPSDRCSYEPPFTFTGTIEK